MITILNAIFKTNFQPHILLIQKIFKVLLLWYNGITTVKGASQTLDSWRLCNNDERASL